MTTQLELPLVASPTTAGERAARKARHAGTWIWLTTPIAYVCAPCADALEAPVRGQHIDDRDWLCARCGERLHGGVKLIVVLRPLDDDAVTR